MAHQRGGLVPIGEAFGGPDEVDPRCLAPGAAPLHPSRSGEPACFGQRSGPRSRLHGADAGVVLGELAGLEFADVAQREGRWAIVDLVGKHGRVLTVPMPSWAKTALDDWATAAGIESGPVRSRTKRSSRRSSGMPALTAPG